MKTIYLLCIVSILLLASCGLHRTTYIAPIPNTPMFGHDSEAYFNAAVSPTHFDFQGGLSFTNHIGITAGRFYSGSIRNSSELGINFFTQTKTNICLATTFGWGQTKIGNYYTKPFNDREHTELHVGYNTLFVQPAIYKIIPTDNGVVRVGLSLKYALNNLKEYSYTEYKTNKNTSADLEYERIYTANKQPFRAITPLLAVEYTRNNISFGGHLGYSYTSKINAWYKSNDYKIPSQSTQYGMKRDLYHLPFILDFYVGIRI